MPLLSGSVRRQTSWRPARCRRPALALDVHLGTYSGYADACRYSFTVENVPTGERSYRVTLGSDISNSVGFTEDQLASRGANITLGH